MRYLTFLSFCVLLMTPIMLWGQETDYSPVADCDNYNAFVDLDSNEGLEYYTDIIYPSGYMILNSDNTEDLTGIDSLYPYMEIDQGTTFELERVTNSRFDSTKKYLKYQQYYQGIKVAGGGYTISGYIADIPVNPSDQLLVVSPYISSGINVDTNSNVSSSNLKSMIATAMSANQNDIENLREELVITHNLLNNCSFHLTYTVNYKHNDTIKTSWIDANAGNVLKTRKTGMRHDAPVSNNKVAEMIVYDITGRMIYSGKPSNFDLHSIGNNSIIICLYLDKYGNVVDSNKKVVIK